MLFANVCLLGAHRTLGSKWLNCAQIQVMIHFWLRSSGVGVASS